MTTSLIDEIRGFLIQSSEQDVDLVAEVASEYAEAIVSCNRRLREVVGLLEKGHASEAMVLAEREPAVLEMVGQLEFPEKDDWLELVVSLGLDVPPEVRLDLAERIEEAYATGQSLEGLLKKHRLLALSRAPLASRIAIQSLLCERDPLNLPWERDLQGLEKGRVKEIASEIQVARSSGDVALAQRLRNELFGRQWSIDIPKETSSLVQKISTELSNRESVGRLKQLSSELHDAFIAFDVEHARALRNEWDSIAKKVGIDRTHDLARPAQDAFVWLAEEDANEAEKHAFDAAVRRLTEGLDRKVSLRDLDRLEYQVRKTEFELPGHLETRLTAVKRKLEQRNRVWLVGGAVAVVLFAAAVVVTVWYSLASSRYDQTLASYKVSLEKAITDQQFGAAEQVLAAMPSSMRSEPVILGLQRTLEEGVENEAQRKGSRAQAIARVTSAGEDAPDLESLKAATELSVSDPEKLEVAELEMRINRRQNELRLERERQFGIELQRFVVQVEKLVSEQPSTELIERIKDLERDINSWKSQYSGYVHGVERISESQRKRVSPLLEQLAAMSKNATMELRQLSAANDITRHIGDPEGFAKQLNVFCQVYMGAPVTGDFAVAGQELAYWRDYEACMAFLKDERWVRYPDLSIEEVSALLQDIDDLQASHSTCQVAFEFQSIVAHFRRTLREQDLSLESLFDRRVVENMKLAVDSKGRRYYQRGEAQEKGSSEVEIEFYLDADLLVTKRRFPKTQLVIYEQAPQCDLYKNIAPIFKKHANGETALTGALLMVLREVITFGVDEQQQSAQYELDPVFRLSTARGIIAAVEAIDPDLSLKLNAFSGPIEAISPDLNEDWVDPDNSDAEASRIRARDAMELFPTIERLDSLILEYRRRAVPPEVPTADYRWIGWLWRSSTGDWSVRHRESGIVDDELYCLIPSGVPSGGMGRFISIGQLENGNLMSDQDLVAGRPVYIKRQARPGTEESQ